MKDEVSCRLRFRERFHERFSDKGGLPILIGMAQNGATLERMGKYFGITRERIRQILQSITIPPVTVGKYETIISKVINSSPHLKMKFGNFKRADGAALKGILGEIKFFESMKTPLNHIEYKGPHAPYDFEMNGFKVDVKHCLTKSIVNTKRGYRFYKFRASKRQLEMVDFFFVITPEGNYLIPISKIRKEYNYITKKSKPYKL